MPAPKNFKLYLLVAVLVLSPLALAWQKDHDMSTMPGMDMGSKSEMRDMGPSMAAMAGHMLVTPLRPMQPGDEARAQAVIEAAKATMARYKDYRKAIADGYVVLRPDVEQPQYHFTNDANAQAAETSFDPSKPTSLLYRRTPHQMYKLEGVMYTARLHETEDELNRRVPLSIGRWHQHTNFCQAPPGVKDPYMGAHPLFGMFGSIKTQQACDAAHGTFFPYMFNWMIHVFPYEKDFSKIFSMNDDIPHVH